MSVPLDNLYHWVESLLPAPAIVYVFRPHGSKNISDCLRLRKYSLAQIHSSPSIILHDQEPLDWEFYNDPAQYLARANGWAEDTPVENAVQKYASNFHLKSIILSEGSKMYDQPILIHSEKNSLDLELYKNNGFVCVHYWAHAIIARDWYRFAQIDTRLYTDTLPKYKFLIYCRDWSHRREYRLKFLELLIQDKIDYDCLTSVMHTSSDDVHFSQHKFSNPAFEFADPKLITCLPDNSMSSSASADYDCNDFVSTQISVVLETVFDDQRIHLTEKTLRPIACGHPFILVAGPGALEYIRSYGFKTFAPWIDESYDLETNSLNRLTKIIYSMKQIQNLHGNELENFSQGIKQIAEFNKKHFFSDEFFSQVQNELKNNLKFAIDQSWQKLGKHYLEILKYLKDPGQSQPLVSQWQNRRMFSLLLRQLRQSYRVDRSNLEANPLA
jgi:hypothetical protein